MLFSETQVVASLRTRTPSPKSDCSGADDVADEQWVYQSTPDIYEDELHNVIQVIDEVKLALGRCEDVVLDEAFLMLSSKDGYPIGKLFLGDDGQWVFTPTIESEVLVSEL
jgi:hypothetical protein